MEKKRCRKPAPRLNPFLTGSLFASSSLALTALANDKQLVRLNDQAQVIVREPCNGDADDESIAVFDQHVVGRVRVATALFGEKYGDEVRVVAMGGDDDRFSVELCGGTHVGNTAEIGLFKIVAESGVAAGIRRIEAVAGPAVLAYLNERDAVVKQLGDRFKAQPSEIVERVSALQEELKATGKALAAAQAELAVAKAGALAAKAEPVGEFQLLVERLDGVDGAGLQGAAQSLADQLGDASAVVLGGLPDPSDLGKVILVAAFGKQVIAAQLQAGKFIGGIAKLCGGGGGGRPNLAQAGGRDGSALTDALAKARSELEAGLQS